MKTRPSARQAAAVALVAVLAVLTLVSAAVGALRMATACLALLLGSVGLVLLDVRRRQQILGRQVKEVRGQLQDTRSRADQAGDRAEAVLDRIAGRLDATVSGLAAQGEALSAAAREVGATRQEVKSVGKAINLLDGRLLTETQALDQLLGRYLPREPLPPVGGWALNPSGLLWLVSFIEKQRPGTVIECGSGTSTLWIAYALRETGRGRLVALDHDAKYARRTADMLAAHGLDDWATVEHAPLTNRSTPRGDFRWYDIEGRDFGPIDLLVVDGPPKATGPLARYPALPALGDHLAAGALVLVDDAQRPDETTAVAHWLEDDPTLEDLGHHSQDVRLLRRSA